MLTIGTTTDRTQRVKDARGEAAKEIEAYKSKQESEFQAFEKEVCESLRCCYTMTLFPLLTSTSC